MDFRILGGLEASDGGVPVDLGRPKQRALLALLLLHPGETIGVDRLVEALWEGDDHAGQRDLHVQVSRLRRAVGRDAVTRRGQGYALAVDPDSIDAHRFEGLCRAGADALAAGDARSGADRLDAALALWRGEPLADLVPAAFVAPEVARLRELRLGALERWYEARLALGEHATLIAGLDAATAEHPWRERLWELRMLALYRSGRQADALAAYQRLRALLRDELGLEPSVAARRLEQAILEQRAELDPVVAAGAPPRPGPGAPAGPALPPAPLTSLVGRDRELDTVAGHLAEGRLVTIVGPAGVGKSRLAVESARRWGTSEQAPVWVVPLGGADDAASVGHHVATTLGADDERGPDAAVAAAVEGAAALVVLDDCDHVAGAAGVLAARLTAACAHLRVLATARGPLGVRGERVVTLAPLAAADAEALFAERAAQAGAPPGDPGAVAAVCRRLDGLPLAIELAAARARALPLDEIAARLVDRVHLLAGGGPDRPAHHRTLTAALDWSYDLLGPATQSALRRLAVFRSPFDLAAAQAVAGGEADMAEELACLVDLGLVVVVEHGPSAGYRLLGTVRAYAAERLAAAGYEAATTRARLARWAATRVAAVERGLRGPDQLRWLAEVDRHHDTFCAAVDADPANPDALAVAAGLWRYWRVRGRPAEGRARLDAVLAAGTGAPPGMLARAEAGAGWLAFAEGDDVAAGAHHARALALREADGDPWGQATSLTALAAVAWHQGDVPAALAHYGRAAAVTARAPAGAGADQLSIADLTTAARAHGEAVDARAVHVSMVALARRRGEPRSLAAALANLAVVEAAQGDVLAAVAAHEEALALRERSGEPSAVAASCLHLARLYAHAGDLDRAVPLAQRALEAYAALDDPAGRLEASSVLAALAP